MAGRSEVDGEVFDKTSLYGNYGYAVHRDYAAHFFRWSHAFRHITTSTAMLDIGCGVDTPMAKAITMRHSRPKSYVGVDMNLLTRAPPRQWATYHGRFDFTRRWKELKREGGYDLIVSFEAIEHMPVSAGQRLLRGARELLAPSGLFMLSTPVFNGSAAKNHVHEYTIEELAAEIKKAKLVVEKRYGTFASYHDVKKVCSKEERALLDQLRDYYDGEVAACFLAPKYPDASRNNVWLLRRQ